MHAAWQLHCCCARQRVCRSGWKCASQLLAAMALVPALRSRCILGLGMQAAERRAGSCSSGGSQSMGYTK
jgi:hypothetical protein